MGQIVKRKKKGRPSKADLARRAGESPPKFEPVMRRSLRRRNVRYNIDIDDYIDEDEEEDEEDERRRLKKLKLVVKLNQVRDGAEPTNGRARTKMRASHAHEYGESASEEEDDESERRPLKKRMIGRSGEEDDAEEEEEERAEEEDDDYDDEHRGEEDGDDDGFEERGGRKVGSKGSDSVPGTPSDSPNGTIPLPDKRTLELILDKLQKKDTYGVYAEPVDPEELPDYHDVIEHPMDFATVRKKLSAGAYSTLEDFESDVFLICSNAMQYNSSDTIYHKQAFAIQELARKKFGRLRTNFENSEKELKLEQKVKPNFSDKKQTRRPLCRTSQEPIGSDFSSGATLATTIVIPNISNGTPLGGGCERPNNIDGFVESNSSPFDTNLEKTEEQLSGKSFLPRLGRKVILDENRRSTYNTSNQPVIQSDSIFATFEGEIRQLVAVGLHAEYSYARSLARFSATLGPVAWKVASKRIEQALPSGYKFGRGWVGEYEPLPTPVLMLENHNQKETNLFTHTPSPTELKKDDKSVKNPFPTKKDHLHPVSGPNPESRSSLYNSPRGHTSDRKPPLFSSNGTRSNPPIDIPSKIFTEPEKMKKQIELNLLPLPNQNSPRMPFSKSNDRQPTMNFNKLPDSNGAVITTTTTTTTTRGLPNGKLVTTPSSNNGPSHIFQEKPSYPHGPEQGNGLSDPVQLMRILAEKAQKQQQKPSNQSPIEAPHPPPPVAPQLISPAPPPMRRDDSENAAAAAARAWMSIGAGGLKKGTENHISADSLYNPAREFHPQNTRISSSSSENKNSFPLQAYNIPPQPTQPTHLENHRPMIFPHFGSSADLSKFQVQSTSSPSWRGLSPHTQMRQKQDMLPPDLNIGFQSPGSPPRQSNGVLVDSQQPDLALQL